jgi:hypothetical protein
MKIGIVTGGGDCPGLNAVIRAVAKTAAKRGWETIGILGGYDGLLPPQIFACWITRRSTACWCAAAPFSARPIADDFPPRPATAKRGRSPEGIAGGDQRRAWRRWGFPRWCPSAATAR